MSRFWLGVAVVVGIAGWPSPGWTCDAVLMDVREMVAQSDVILLAEVTGSTPGSPDKSGLVALRVLELLKGSFSAKTLTVEGQVNLELTAPGVKGPVPYTELDCTRAGLCGGCYARDYRDGARYLLFLKRGELYWAPLAPANEEVAGPDDPWVAWTKQQLMNGAPSALPSAESGFRKEASTDSVTRLQAIEAMKASKDPLPDEAAATLRDFLSDPDTGVLLGALELLKTMGPAAAPAVPAVAALLKDDTTHYIYGGTPEWQEGIGQDIHGPALEVLGAIGRGAKDAVPAIVEFFNKHKAPTDAYDVGRRDLALEALAKIGPDAASAVPVLADYIKDASPLGQWFHSSPSLEAQPFIPVFSVLERIGPAAKAAVLNLKRYTGLPHTGRVRQAALQAILAIDPGDPDLYPIALRSLRQVTEPMIQEDEPLALEIIRRRPSYTRKEIRMAADLLKQLTEKRQGAVGMNEAVNAAFCDVFAAHKDVSLDAVPVLANIVDLYPTQGAVSGLPTILQTLGALGPAADAAVPAIKKKVLDPWFTIEGYREAGVEALRQIGTPAAQAALEEYEAKKKTNFW